MTLWLSRQSQPVGEPPCGEWFSAAGVDYLCGLTRGHDGPHRGRPTSVPYEESDVGTVE